MLETLLYPLTPAAFFHDIWEQRHHLLRRDSPGYYDSLITIGDVDALTAQVRLDPGGWAIKTVRYEGDRMVTPRVMCSADGTPRIHALYRAYTSGQTIVVNDVDARWSAIGVFCRQIEAELRCRVTSNLYLTPPAAQGFTPHYDSHDVFVLQIDGSKTWRIYDGPRRLPLPGDGEWYPPTKDRRLVEELTLEAGDLLYIPRGHVHDARASTTRSLHLTIGAHVVRWSDLLQDVVTAAADGDERLRGAVPPAMLTEAVSGNPAPALEQRLRELLAHVAANAQGHTVATQRMRNLLSSTEPPRAGHFQALDRAEDIQADTPLRRRPVGACLVWVLNGRASLQYPGNLVSGTAALEPTFRFIAGTDAFTANDLPGRLDAQARVTLVRRLASEGLLEIAASAPQ